MIEDAFRALAPLVFRECLSDLACPSGPSVGEFSASTSVADLCRKVVLDRKVQSEGLLGLEKCIETNIKAGEWRGG
jgi:hypothetical protein